jgi:hypothetical protein
MPGATRVADTLLVSFDFTSTLLMTGIRALKLAGEMVREVCRGRAAKVRTERCPAA